MLHDELTRCMLYDDLSFCMTIASQVTSPYCCKMSRHVVSSRLHDDLSLRMPCRKSFGMTACLYDYITSQLIILVCCMMTCLFVVKATERKRARGREREGERCELRDDLSSCSDSRRCKEK